MKTILAVCFKKRVQLFLLHLCLCLALQAQWDGNSDELLTSGDATIQNLNPYLFLNIQGNTSARGGLQFQHQGTLKARLTYQPTHFMRFIGEESNGQELDVMTLHMGQREMTPTSGGFVQFGDRSGQHLDFDHNEIQARSGSNLNDTLYLNARGGDVFIGSNGLYYESTNGFIGIGTTTPGSALDVNGSAMFDGSVFFNDPSGFRHGSIYTINSSDLQINSRSGIILSTNDGVANDVVIDFGKVGIGTTDPEYVLDVQGSGNFTGELTAASDLRFKENISPIGDALSIVNNLNPVSYDFKTEEFSNMNFSDGRRYGLLAQEVEKVLPELVTKKGEEEYRSLNYIDLFPFLIKSIQELQAEITNFKSKIEESHNE